MNLKTKLSKIKLNKKLFLKIYIPIVIILAVALIILQALGSKSRIGYLNEFDLLETNYNENTTNYIYHFKIGYYNKTFKHSDIYGVYPDLSNLPEFVKEIKMDEAGSPFGNLISDSIINEYKIEINYTLTVKLILFLSIILILTLIFILFYSIKNRIRIKSIFIRIIKRANELENINIVPIITIVLTLIMFIRNISSITNAQLWAEDANIFLQGCLDYGIKSLFMPYAGYLHTIPRLIMILSYGLSSLLNKGIILVPYFSVFISTVIGAYCISYVCSKKFSWLAPLKFRILLSLLLCFVPQTSEVYYNPTNLHWLIGYFLFLISLNIVHYKSIPKGLILIWIFLFSLSSTFVVFIGLASIFLFLDYIYNSIKNNKLKINIKSVICKSFELLLINFGLIIHAIIILFLKRGGAGNPSISYIIEAGLYLLVRLFVDIEKMQNIYLIVLLMFLTYISIKFFKLKYCYIIIFYIMSIFMICSGNDLQGWKFYLNNVRYIFIPTSILLTFVMANLSINHRDMKSDKIKYIISIILIMVISIRYFIFNFINPFILIDLKWKEFSSMYSTKDKYKDKIFIPVNPGNQWGVKINTDNIRILDINDFKFYNKNIIADISYINEDSFLYFTINDFDLNIVYNNIDTNSDNIEYLKLEKYKYDKYYLINLKEYKNIRLIIDLHTNNYNNILNNFKIIKKLY